MRTQTNAILTIYRDDEPLDVDIIGYFYFDEFESMSCKAELTPDEEYEAELLLCRSYNWESGKL